MRQITELLQPVPPLQQRQKSAASPLRCFRSQSRPPARGTLLPCAAPLDSERCSDATRAESGSLTRRASTLAALSTIIISAQQQLSRADDSVAGLGNVENATEDVQAEEKVAISSNSSTRTLGARGAQQKLPEGEYKTLNDSTLAYSFSYPVSLKGDKLAVILSRRPERYSSAAPLSPDARQRIVSELVDFSRGLVISMTVGPPSGVLKGRQPNQWKPKEVAQTVLIDRSTARVTVGQRVALQQIENVQSEARDGTDYWTYEHLSQGSPNLQNRNKETYRHAISVTAWRPGQKGTPFLYTLNLSCPDETWSQYEPVFQQAVATFRLSDPGKGYIPPDKDPWRFF